MKKLFIIVFAFVVIMNSCELEDLINQTDDPRENIVDTWKIENETLKSLKVVYYVDVVKHETDSTKVLLYNFHNLGEDVYVEGTFESFKVSILNYATSDGFKINGSGTISLKYKEINWNYSVDINDGDPQSYSSTFTRIE